MATRPIDDQHWTFEEYFEWEDQQPEKYELIDGRVVRRNREPLAMVGVTIRHGQTVTNIQAALKTKLRGSGCRAYGPEVRLHLSATDDIFYPDVFVACDRSAEAEREVVDAAVVVIEVISPSTGAYDYGEKLHAYIALPSLRAYVLIDPDSHRIDMVVRDGDRWILPNRMREDAVELAAIGVTLTPAEIFDEVGPPRSTLAAADVVLPPPEVLRRRRAPD